MTFKSLMRSIVFGNPPQTDHEPSKDLMVEFGNELDIAVQAASAGLVRSATWTGLAASPGTRAGQPGQSSEASGTHTDPVVGGTVPNGGEFRWSMSPAGWERVDNYLGASAIEATMDAVDAALATVSGKSDRAWVRATQPYQIGIFDPRLSEVGKFLNGADGTTSTDGSNTVAVSGYLPVTLGERLFWKTAIYSIAFYDDTLTFISGAVSGSPVRNDNDVEFPPPGARYLRFHYPAASASQFGVVSGGNALPPNGIWPAPYGGSNPWAGKRYVAIGDSHTAFGVYQPALCQINNMVFASFTNAGQSGRKMIDMPAFLTDAVADSITADVTTLLLGTNDWGTVGSGGSPLGTLASAADGTTYMGALKYTIEKLGERKPGMRLIAGTPFLWPTPDGGAVNGLGLTLKQYADGVIAVCELYSIPVVDFYRLSGFNTQTFAHYLGDDLIHTDTAGFDVLARLFAGAIRAL